jgi:hypothetical protein
MHFLVFFQQILPLKRYKIEQTTYWKKNLMKNTYILYLIWLKFLFQKIEKKIVFLAWIRIKQKCRIRIRI